MSETTDKPLASHTADVNANAITLPTELVDLTDDVTCPVAGDKQHKVESENERQDKAARLIQRTYRGYRTRRELNGFGINASTRWVEAMKEAGWHQLTRPHLPSNTDDQESHATDDSNAARARRNWKRVANVALRAGGDDNFSNGSSLEGRPKHRTSETISSSVSSPVEPQSQSASPSKRRLRGQSLVAGSELPPEKMAKMMDLQYFLEMVDLKHRHGSNLRLYHNHWKNSPSNQNFFYWLDYGEGKDVELPRCPRERLDREQVRYLTREERMQYLVTVDEAGRFRWAKNGERVWTDNARFKDSLNGVVPIDDDTPRFLGYSEDGVPVANRPGSSSSSSSSSSSHGGDSSELEQYASSEFDDSKGIKKLVHASPAVIFNHLMQKSLKREDMWIFVADTSYRLYIGIKKSGAFQHSSFLRGARITAAGLIRIKDGQLRTISPLSGHYRPPAANFRAFVHALQDQGVDMSRVSISKSYAVLVGIEGYTKTKHKLRHLHEKVDSSKQKHHPR